MKTQAIIPTAGAGHRLNANQPKPLVDIKGKPLFIYTLEAFEKSPLIDSIIIVVHEDLLSDYEKWIKRYNLKKISKIVPGGVTRCASVRNGLKVLDQDTEILLVHDGVRPLISQKIIEDAVNECRTNDAVVVAVPVKPTIKKVNKKNMFIEETLNRDELWEIQTPQVFKKDILLKAHEKNTDENATDDAILVEQMGVKVKVLNGDYANIKITTNEDLIVTEAFLNLR